MKLVQKYFCTVHNYVTLYSFSPIVVQYLFISSNYVLYWVEMVIIFCWLSCWIYSCKSRNVIGNIYVGIVDSSQLFSLIVTLRWVADGGWTAYNRAPMQSRSSDSVGGVTLLYFPLSTLPNILYILYYDKMAYNNSASVQYIYLPRAVITIVSGN